MSLGVVMLCHEALGRASQVARHWADAGCPVVIHVDARVPGPVFEAFRATLEPHPLIRFSRRRTCHWGTWSLVGATQDAAALLLSDFPGPQHVFLTSGSCLPLRPVRELVAYLGAHRGTSFIESVTTEDVPWTQGGLDIERFTLRFPFSWKHQRRLFDRYVALQRRVGFRRRLPAGIVPHLGAQWWCLSRDTLAAILSDPARPQIDRFFKRVWIPDEGYFQTLVRRHSDRVESRSLTLAKFDYRGKPHVFYDDHLQLLRRSECFVARKMWPHADQLYATFLNDTKSGRASGGEPAPARVDRLFAKAAERQIRGRTGLRMTSRFPYGWHPGGRTASRYAVFQGFDALFEDFPLWLGRATGLQAHGHLYAPGGAEFADGAETYAGTLSAHAALRDHAPYDFLRNLVWSTRGQRQAFLFGPSDRQDIVDHLAGDPNADVLLITGGWALQLFRSGRPFDQARKTAAHLQRVEGAQLSKLRAGRVAARVHIWSLAEFVEAPLEPLRMIQDDVGGRAAKGRLTELPRMVDLTGFGAFLQALRNAGMQPHLVGDFPAGAEEGGLPAAPLYAPIRASRS